MRHADSIERLEGALAAVGSFDGIHLGHQAVLRTLAEESKRQGRPSAVVSFFWEKSQEALTTELEKAYYMEKLGVDVMLSLPGDAYAGAEALKELLTEKMNVGGIVAGTGCPEQRCLKAWGIPWYPVDAVEIGGKPVTAARVRDCLDGGRMEELERLCGHPYFMLGKVVHGRALGRTVGMPTANLKIYGTKRRPPNGVYATRTYIEGKAFLGVTNVGLRPSVDDRDEITIETMLDDFGQDIYGEKIITEFPLFLRETKKLDGLEAVRRQVEKDMAQARGSLL